MRRRARKRERERKIKIEIERDSEDFIVERLSDLECDCMRAE